MDPFGMPATFRLLVAEKDAARASRLFTDLAVAEPQFPAGDGLPTG
jgi:hypothetical protein